MEEFWTSDVVFEDDAELVSSASEELSNSSGSDGEPDPHRKSQMRTRLDIKSRLHAVRQLEEATEELRRNNIKRAIEDAPTLEA